MNDSDLKYIQRVLESNAPDEDRERAAQMVRDIRRGYGQAPAHLLERLRRHAADTTNTAFSRSAMTEALQYLERAQAPAANGDAPTARELDMAMLIKRLAATLRVAWPESTYMKAADDAMDSLNRWGLAGSPLREGGE